MNHHHYCHENPTGLSWRHSSPLTHVQYDVSTDTLLWISDHRAETLSDSVKQSITQCDTLIFTPNDFISIVFHDRLTMSVNVQQQLANILRSVIEFTTFQSCRRVGALFIFPLCPHLKLAENLILKDAPPSITKICPLLFLIAHVVSNLGLLLSIVHVMTAVLEHKLAAVHSNKGMFESTTSKL